MNITFILGCGRSGTGILTKTLNENGYSYYKEHMSSNGEDNRIYQINEKILNTFNYRYYTIDREINNTSISDAMNCRIKDLITEYKKLENPVIKDPRMLFLYPCWIKYCEDYNFIGIFRHPSEVVASHIRRSPSLSEETILDSWVAHNRQLLKLQERFCFPIIDFNSNNFIEEISTILGMEIKSTLFTPKRITTTKSVFLNTEVLDIYNKLKNLKR